MPGRTDVTAIGRVITASPGANVGRIDPVRTLEVVMCSPNRAKATTTAMATTPSAKAHCIAFGIRSEHGSDICADAVVADMDELSGGRTVGLAMHAAQSDLRRSAERVIASRD